MFSFIRNCHTLPDRLYHFSFSPAVNESFGCSISLPTLSHMYFIEVKFT